MIKVALNNIIQRFDVKLTNIYEMNSDSNSYGALGYLIEDKVYLIAPSRSQYTKKIPNGKKIGELVEINGNYQSKEYALIKKLNIPAFVIDDEKIFFNAQPFTNFQKWLQFENNITPYLKWYDRMFWLDEYSSQILQFIQKYSPKNIQNFIDKEEKENVIIFRHDVDSSTNLAYLNEAIKNNISATYAILLDKNRKFWLNNLKKYSNIEIAFHYETNYVTIYDYIKIAMNKFFKTSYKIENLPRNWKKNSLIKQLNNAISKGIEISTIHRHFAFMKYPEIIEEFEKITKKYPKCLGGGEFYRCKCVKI